MEDNQGTWCSFKFPDDAAREIGFGTAQEGYPNRMEAFRHEIPCFEDITYVEFSAVTGEGVEELRELLDELTEGAEITPVEAYEDEDGGSEDSDEVFEEPEEAVDEDFVEPDSDNPFGGFLKPRGRKN